MLTQPSHYSLPPGRHQGAICTLKTHYKHINIDEESTHHMQSVDHVQLYQLQSNQQIRHEMPHTKIDIQGITAFVYKRLQSSVTDT